MDCPRCKSTLIQGHYNEQVALRCNQCAGIMVKQRSLLKIIEKLSGEIVSGHHTNTPIEVKNPTDPVGHCPECSTSMEHYGYMESKKIMIDVCPSCNWLWTDPHELAQMTQMYIDTQRQCGNMRVHQGIDMVGVAALEAAFIEGFGLGGISSIGDIL